MMFLTAFLGNLLSIGFVGAIVYLALRRDIERAQDSVMADKAKDRALLNQFIKAANDSVVPTDKDKLN